MWSLRCSACSRMYTICIVLSVIRGVKSSENHFISDLEFSPGINENNLKSTPIAVAYDAAHQTTGSVSSGDRAALQTELEGSYSGGVIVGIHTPAKLGKVSGQRSINCQAKPLISAGAPVGKKLLANTRQKG